MMAIRYKIHQTIFFSQESAMFCIRLKDEFGLIHAKTPRLASSHPSPDEMVMGWDMFESYMRS